MADQKKHPFWMPPGGIGALLFWAGLCVFLGASTFYYFDQATMNESRERVLSDEEQLYIRENQQLRSQVDKLQGDLAEKGSILLNREQILQQTTESLKQIQKEKEAQSALHPPDTKKSRNDLFAQLTNSLKSQPELTGCLLIQDDQGIILRVNNSLLFNPGEQVVNAKGIELLKLIALLIKSLSLAPVIELQSHTDDLQPSETIAGLYPTNWELSARRAASILRVMSNEGGIPAKNLKAVGMADSRPIVANDSKENRALNRRLDIVLNPAQ